VVTEADGSQLNKYKSPSYSICSA